MLYSLCLLLLLLTAPDPPTTPPSNIAVGFHAIPFDRMSADCRVIEVGPLWPLIVRSMRAEEVGS